MRSLLSCVSRLAMINFPQLTGDRFHAGHTTSKTHRLGTDARKIENARVPAVFAAHAGPRWPQQPNLRDCSRSPPATSNVARLDYAPIQFGRWSARTVSFRNPDYAGNLLATPGNLPMGSDSGGPSRHAWEMEAI